MYGEVYDTDSYFININHTFMKEDCKKQAQKQRQQIAISAVQLQATLLAH